MVKLTFPGGFAMVRPSGTEPVVRLYVEASTDLEVRETLAALHALTLRHSRSRSDGVPPTLA